MNYLAKQFLTARAVGVMLVAAFVSLSANADDNLPGLSFEQDDWELVCDNTGTCRVAGYSPDSDGLKVTVLLTREAGKHKEITGELKFGQFDQDFSERGIELQPGTTMSMEIDDRVVGKITTRGKTAAIRIPAEHIQLIFSALRRHTEIEWVRGGLRWRLSDKGAVAAFLKMDEFQRRIGTKGALLNPGPIGEGKVLMPSPRPVVVAVPVPKFPPTNKLIIAGKSKALWKALRATVNAPEDCMDMLDHETDEPKLSLTRVSANKLLVSNRCNIAPYNSGDVYWLINDTPPFAPVVITTAGTGYRSGTISSVMKGRGLADCLGIDKWTWDGRTFAHTSSYSTGQCRMMAPGGTWIQPRIVSDLRAAPR